MRKPSPEQSAMKEVLESMEDPAIIGNPEPFDLVKLEKLAARNGYNVEHVGDNPNYGQIYRFTLKPKKGRPRIGTRVTITLPDHTLAHVRAVAEKTGCPVAEVIREYCEAMQATAWSRNNGS